MLRQMIEEDKLIWVCLVNRITLIQNNTVPKKLCKDSVYTYLQNFFKCKNPFTLTLILQRHPQ